MSSETETQTEIQELKNEIQELKNKFKNEIQELRNTFLVFLLKQNTYDNSPFYEFKDLEQLLDKTNVNIIFEDKNYYTRLFPNCLTIRCTLLHKACLSFCYSKIKMLLEHGADIRMEIRMEFKIGSPHRSPLWCLVNNYSSIGSIKDFDYYINSKTIKDIFDLFLEYGITQNEIDEMVSKKYSELEEFIKKSEKTSQENKSSEPNCVIS